MRPMNPGAAGARDAELEGRVIAVVAECLSCDVEGITREANLEDDLHADSLDLLELPFHLEKAFGIQLAVEQLAAQTGSSSATRAVRSLTVADVIAAVRQALDDKDTARAA